MSKKIKGLIYSAVAIAIVSAGHTLGAAEAAARFHSW